MTGDLRITYVTRGLLHGTYHDVPCRNLRNLRRKVRQIMRNPDVARILLRREAGSPLADATIVYRNGKWTWSARVQAGIRRLMGKGWKP